MSKSTKTTHELRCDVCEQHVNVESGEKSPMSLVTIQPPHGDGGRTFDICIRCLPYPVKGQRFGLVWSFLRKYFPSGDE